MCTVFNNKSMLAATLLFMGVGAASPSAFAEDKSVLLAPMIEQTRSVLNHCVSGNIDADKQAMQKDGFVSVVNGVANAEMPKDFAAFVDFFYQEAGKSGEFFVKQDDGKFIVIIIDSNNSCNSPPSHGDLNQLGPLMIQYKAERLNGNVAVSGNMTFKREMYKVNQNVVVNTEIVDTQNPSVSYVTTTRLY